MNKGRVVILGNFDGVHIGHQALVFAGKKAAEDLGCTLSAWTFESIPGDMLCRKEEREELLIGYGVEEVIFASFDDVKGLSAEQFVIDILKNELNARVAVCGYNYSFGAGGKGTPELLCELCKEQGIAVNVVERVSVKDADVSSSRIRALISDGEVKEASELLGRPFFLRGMVVHGAGLGRTVGIPTVNFDMTDGLCLPRFGVYATLIRVNNEVFTSVTNVGVRPTVNDKRGITAETHILNFEGDLYGKTVTVEFLRFIREESVFPSLEALSRQIALDSVEAEAEAKEHFGKG